MDGLESLEGMRVRENPVEEVALSRKVEEDRRVHGPCQEGGNYPTHINVNRIHWDWEFYRYDFDQKIYCHPLAATNGFRCWEGITAVSVACLPNLKALSFPRWYEAFDKGMGKSMHISAVVAAFGSKQRAQSNAGLEVNGHLSKLRSLDGPLP